MSDTTQALLTIALPPGIETPPVKGTPEYEAYVEEKLSHPPFTFSAGSRYELCGAHNWYPVASQIVKTPKTIFVPVGYELCWLLDGITPKGFDTLLARLDAACTEIGYPAFLRTAYTSGKHGWKDTCGGITCANDISSAVTEIVGFSNMGFPEQPCHLFMVREMISTKRLFTAFADMPITREFRFFVSKDKITHVQPYWPPHAVAETVQEDVDWESLLQEASVMTQKEYDFLETMTAKIGMALPDHEWSVDWLQDKNGDWWMIDMAIAGLSFKWEPDFEIVSR